MVGLLLLPVAVGTQYANVGDTEVMMGEAGWGWGGTSRPKTLWQAFEVEGVMDGDGVLARERESKS